MSGESGDVPEIGPAQLEAIYRHARASFPNECCGFLVGSGPDSELVECENWQDRYHALDPETFPRTAANAYTFGAKDSRRLAESFDSNVPATLIYHSHPLVGAYFSAEDARAASSADWPLDYLVVDCGAEEIREAKLFRRQAETDTYVEVARFDGAAI